MSIERMRVRQTAQENPIPLSFSHSPEIPYRNLKTSFQWEIPSTLSTGTGDEIPGFPQLPGQLESELRFPVITIGGKRISDDWAKNMKKHEIIEIVLVALGIVLTFGLMGLILFSSDV
jgi:hypothetical protein